MDPITRALMMGASRPSAAVTVPIQFVGGLSGGREGSTSTTKQSLSGTLTGGIASSPAAGDVIFVGVMVSSQGRSPSCAISGWSTVGSQVNETAGMYDTSLQVSYMVAGVTPPTEFTIPSTGNTADAQSWVVLVFRGVLQESPINPPSVGASASGTGTTRADPPSFTPTKTGAFVVAIGGGAAATATTPLTSGDLSGFFANYTADTNDSSIGGGYIEWSGSGAVDPNVFGGGNVNVQNSWAAKTFAILQEDQGPQRLYSVSGTYAFRVPDDVTEISAVAVGGGGGGVRSSSGGTGGGGGDLRYSSAIAVTPGEILTVTVGAGGTGGASATAGGESSLYRGATRLLSAAGGGPGRAGNTSGSKNGTSLGTGGNGGTSPATNATNASGGGGAGGYSGNGGNGGLGAEGSNGNGGGGGGGGGGGSPSSGVYGGNGGGVGVMGAGSNGSGGAYNMANYGSPGSGGSSGATGTTWPAPRPMGGAFGGGGGGTNGGTDAGGGANGAVRIIWGAGRSYPSTNTTDE